MIVKPAQSGPNHHQTKLITGRKTTNTLRRLRAASVVLAAEQGVSGIEPHLLRRGILALNEFLL